MCQMLDISETVPSKPTNVYSDEVIEELCTVIKAHNLKLVN